MPFDTFRRQGWHVYGLVKFLPDTQPDDWDDITPIAKVCPACGGWTTFAAERCGRFSCTKDIKSNNCTVRNKYGVIIGSAAESKDGFIRKPIIELDGGFWSAHKATVGEDLEYWADDGSEWRKVHGRKRGH